MLASFDIISSLPGSSSRTHPESLSKPRDSTSILKTLLGKLDIKRHHLEFSTYVSSSGYVSATIRKCLFIDYLNCKAYIITIINKVVRTL